MSPEGRTSTVAPHSAKAPASALFKDFLGQFERVKNFYGRSPVKREWLAEECAAIEYDKSRRELVADVLERQSQAFGALSEHTRESLKRFRNGAAVVVTGQQVSLFGGPLFSLLKALTAVQLAEESTSGGNDCVPIFWLATEDHDLAEVNNALIPTREGEPGKLERLVVNPLAPDHSLDSPLAPSHVPAAADARRTGVPRDKPTGNRFSSSSSGSQPVLNAASAPHSIPPPGAPVGQVFFGEEIRSLVERATALLGEGEVSDYLQESYRSGESFGTAFAKLWARTFSEFGILMVDASDPELHRIAMPIYRQALDRAGEIGDALQQRNQELESAGYNAQVKVTPSSTTLFFMQQGKRLPLRRAHRGFVVGEQEFSSATLQEKVTRHPEDFSPNVLLRPVIQDYLFPTLCYVGGPSEVAYFAQAAVIYSKLLRRITPIVPRLSATLVEPRVRKLLDRYGLTVEKVLESSGQILPQIAAHALPPDLSLTFDSALAALEDSIKQIKASLQELDITLVQSAEQAESKMRYQIERLRTRAANAQLRRHEELSRHAEELSNLLYPHKNLQEREILGLYYLARYGKQLLHQIKDAARQSKTGTHQILFLSSP